MSLYMLILSSALAVLVLGYRMLQINRRSRSAVASNRRATTSVRAIELGILVILAAIFAMFIASDGLARPIPIRSFTIIRGSTIAAVFLVTACAVVLAIVQKVSISRIAFGTTGLLLLGSFVFASADPLAVEKHVDEIRQIPVPVEVSLNPPIANVEVIINGVSMGATPLTMTISDIVSKTSSRDETRPPTTPTTSIGYQTYYETKRIQLGRANDVVKYDHHEKPLELDFEFKRDGQRLLIDGNMGWSGPSRMFGQITPAKIDFNVTTLEWSRDTELLLMKARLADYHVDHDWIEAAESFADFVRPAILHAMRNEPEFQQVLDDWAIRRYRLDLATDPESAWSALQSICDQADQLNAYSTDSTPGDAIELLVARLAPDKLISAVETRLAVLKKDRAGDVSYSWNSQAPRRSFTFVPSFSGMSKPSDFVLAHVIWKLDGMIPKSGSNQDNAIEARIAPPLLQLSYSHPNVRSLAEAIGGSVIEEFHRRLARDVSGYQPSPDPTQNSFIEGEMVLQKFWMLVNLQDDVGAQFRRNQVYYAVEFAKQKLAKSHSMMSIPTWMDFLFLPVAGREPLAREVWHAFESAVAMDAGSEWHSLNSKWNYLARMRPIPGNSEFIRVVQKANLENQSFFDAEKALAPLPEAIKFQIAMATLPLFRKSLETRDKYSAAYSMDQRSIDQIHALICSIPTDEAVDFIQRTLDTAETEKEPLLSLLNARSQSARLTQPLIIRLSHADDPKCRRLVLAQLKLLPTTANVELLERFKQDPDAKIQSEATEIAAQLESIRRSPLPKWIK